MTLSRPFGGPGRNRTCDLGIKSPSGRVATHGDELKEPATETFRGCNELQRNAGFGDKPVRAFVRSAVARPGNSPLGPRRPALPFEVRTGSNGCHSNSSGFPGLTTRP